MLSPSLDNDSINAHTLNRRLVVDAGHLIQSAVLTDKNTMDEQPDRLLRPRHYRLAVRYSFNLDDQILKGKLKPLRFKDAQEDQSLTSSALSVPLRLKLRNHQNRALICMNISCTLTRLMLDMEGTPEPLFAIKPSRGDLLKTAF
ncbi:MAG: hypothetical protein V7735_07170 [Photobacterium frigidiphilum]|uniref:hypothetical protein n=1 Tax=Photobacterium frigidiphilum TaxID=264736 RepID=UPI0030022157